MSLSSSVAPRLAAVALLALAPTLATAADEAHSGNDHNQIDGVRMDVHVDLGNYGAFGMGIRGDIPIVANGLIDGVDDELAISVGAEVFFVNFWHDRYNGRPYIVPLAVLQWNFYVGKNWSVFPEVGIAFFVGDDDLPGGGPFYPSIASGIGARYHFQKRNALLMRVSWPAGLQVGLTF